MIAIIDYDAGNIKSVEKAFHKLGYETQLTSRREDILSADHVVLPGVGCFADAMEHERYEEALDALIQGTYTYVRNQDAAAELKISDAFNALGAQIEKSMMDEFGVSESAAMDMYAIHKRPDYTRAVREVLKSVNLEY